MRATIGWLAVIVAASACGSRLVAVPTPTAAPDVCASVTGFGATIDATYPKGTLESQQAIVPVVGMDRLEPIEPAFEYLAARGIANGSNVTSYASSQTALTTALVQICRADGTLIAVNMYQPFPLARSPIWAVRSYRFGR